MKELYNNDVYDIICNYLELKGLKGLVLESKNNKRNVDS